MASLTPGARDSAGPRILSAPLVPSVAQVAEAPPEQLPPLPPVTWDHMPVEPTEQDIQTAKRGIVQMREAAAHIQEHIDQLENDLAAIDPALVLSVEVAGYTDPPERVIAAGSRRQAIPPQP